MDKKNTGRSWRDRLAICALLLTCQYSDSVCATCEDCRRRNNGLDPEENPRQAHRNVHNAGRNTPTATTTPTQNQWFTDRSNIYTAYNNAIGNTDRTMAAHDQSGRSNAVFPTLTSHMTLSNPWLRNDDSNYHSRYSYRNGSGTALQSQSQLQPQLMRTSSYLPMQTTSNSWSNNHNSGNRRSYQITPTNSLSLDDWQGLLNTTPTADTSRVGALPAEWNSDEPIDQGNWMDMTNMGGTAMHRPQNLATATAMPRPQNLAHYSWPNIQNGIPNISSGSLPRNWNNPDMGGNVLYPATQILQFNPTDSPFFSNSGSNSNSNNNSTNSNNSNSNNTNSNSWPMRGTDGNWYHGSSAVSGGNSNNVGNWLQSSNPQGMPNTQSNSNRSSNRGSNQWSNMRGNNTAPVSPMGALPSPTQWMMVNRPNMNYNNGNFMGGQPMPGPSTGPNTYGNMFR